MMVRILTCPVLPQDRSVVESTVSQVLPVCEQLLAL